MAIFLVNNHIGSPEYGKDCEAKPSFKQTVKIYLLPCSKSMFDKAL